MRVASLILLLLTSCFPREAPLEPCFNRVPQASEVAHLPSPFPTLTTDERHQDWAVEYEVGVQFARELDLYRAVTSFKRALFLLPEHADASRRLELHYYIVLSYYLGDKHADAVRTFEESPLTFVDGSFGAFHDLALMLYDSYEALGDQSKARAVYQALESTDPQDAHFAALSMSLRNADLPVIERDLAPLAEQYAARCKSVQTAQTLSALCPGAGFWYVGQKQSAITSFLLNSLFIAATYQFFSRGYWAAGVFTSSLEAGWYFGGIYGAGEAAYDYNVRLYEGVADAALERGNLYPTLMLRWGF
jgi:tetratricopeptide (TPR) repeat protein